MEKIIKLLLIVFTAVGCSHGSEAEGLKEGMKAPVFKVKNHRGEEFDLESRKGKWTVLYFYPKADTPGCTKQACAFRDSISNITDQNAEVYGISTDTVSDQNAFREKYKLNFDLLADPDGKVSTQYGTKRKLINISKRWTFIIDPTLTIRYIDKDVDPVKDAEKVGNKLKELQANI